MAPGQKNVSRIKIFYIRPILLCALTAIIILHLLSSLPGLYHSVDMYQHSKHIDFLNDVSDDLFAAVGNYGFERGRVNVVLNDAGPVEGMEANRNFINARRTQGDQALADALEKLSGMASAEIQSRIAALKNVKKEINRLRNRTAKDLVVPKDQREKGLAEVWFEAMTRFIISIERLLVTISREISDADGMISRYSALKHEILGLRNTAGPEMSILSATILSREPIKTNLKKKIETLHIITKQHFEKISFLCQGFSSPSIPMALKKLEDSYFKDYLPYRNEIFPLADTGGPYPYSQKEFLGHGVRTLKEIANFMGVIVADTKKYAADRLERSRDQISYTLLSSLGSLTVLILIIFFINYKIIKPVGLLTGITRRLAKNDLEVKVSYTGEANEIGDLARALKVFKKMALQLEEDNILLKAAEGKIRKSEEKLMLILNSLTDMILEIDPGFRIIWANKAALILTPDTVGKICYEAFPGNDRVCEGCVIAEAFETGEIKTGIQYQPASETDKESYWESIGIPIKDEGGKIITVLEVSRNITDRRKAETEKETLIKDLKEALAKVKTLSGLLPICANCKKIRDDKGYWNKLEAYIQDHSEASFSHGMCPDCMDEIYGNEDWYIHMKKKKELK